MSGWLVCTDCVAVLSACGHEIHGVVFVTEGENQLASKGKKQKITVDIGLSQGAIVKDPHDCSMLAHKPT